MSDIFISYSRKDSEQALSLAERLRGEGMSVWIDQQGIEAAKTRSGEIVDAIEGCKAFLMLLSSHSMQSENVAKELSIAFENKRQLLPVAIEDVALARDFKYPLAGVQRVAYTQFDSIRQALTSIGVVSSSPKANQDTRKSLMILPFEDLSPTQDNGWFADGLVSELIGKLSIIKSLKLVDRQTSLQIKKKGHSIAELAQILEVRYFIEGSIRKFGEDIKIDVGLLDFETGDYLWQDTHKGVFADIFDIQEAIANKVVRGLQLHLGAKEEKEIKKKITENSEAYEFFLKGTEEYAKQTRAGLERAIQLYTHAARLDPNSSSGFTDLANAHLAYYRSFVRDPSRLEAAQAAISEVHRIEGESQRWCWIMSRLHFSVSDYIQAEFYARRAIESDPDFHPGYDALGSALRFQNKLKEAIEALGENVRLRPNKISYWMLLSTTSESKDSQVLASTAIEALPVFEKNLKLNPEDRSCAVEYANVLYFAGRLEEAKSRAYELLAAASIDAFALYNLACLFVNLDDNSAALDSLRLSLERGYSDIETFRRDPDLDPLRDMEEFKAIVAELEAKIAKQLAASDGAPAT